MALLTSIAARARALLLLCGFLLFGAGEVVAQDREYALKAVFLYNFSQFVDWPASAFPAASSPLVIGVIGSDPFGRLLEEAVAGETVRGRRIQILRTQRVEDVRLCHIAFVSRSDAARVGAILNAARGSNTLTVGETEEFLASGGMIALVKEQGKVRVKMNTAAVRAANLAVSSKLMRIASQR